MYFHFMTLTLSQHLLLCKFDAFSFWVLLSSPLLDSLFIHSFIHLSCWCCDAAVSCSSQLSLYLTSRFSPSSSYFSSFFMAFDVAVVSLSLCSNILQLRHWYSKTSKDGDKLFFFSFFTYFDRFTYIVSSSLPVGAHQRAIDLNLELFL